MSLWIDIHILDCICCMYDAVRRSQYTVCGFPADNWPLSFGGKTDENSPLWQSSSHGEECFVQRTKLGAPFIYQMNLVNHKVTNPCSRNFIMDECVVFIC